MKSGGRVRGLLSWRDYAPIIAFCLLAAAISYLLGPDRYTQRILVLIFLWTVACNSWNIISGYGGQIVFGHMMFVGTGAFTTVLLFKYLHWSPWLGMWIGVVAAVVIAGIIGLPTLHLRGAYFAVATVAFPLMTIPILNYLGLEEVSIPFRGFNPVNLHFADVRWYTLLGVALLAITLILVQTMERSRFGFSLRALKENEAAAQAMGIDTFRYKLLAFMLSAGIAALMGVFYTYAVLYLLTTNAVFGLFIIVRILSITLVGGVASVWGPLIGAAILVPLGEVLNAQVGDRYPGIQDIVFGMALLIAIILAPEGIWGKARELLLRFRRGPSTFAPATVAVGPSYPSTSDTPGDYGLVKFGPSAPKVAESAAQEAILKIEGVSKFFGGVHALEDVSIEVPPNKTLGIIGPNGAGKTTLFNVISGYFRPEKGRVLFEGKDITGGRTCAIAGLGIGRTFQIAQIFRNMTVLENVMIGAFARARNAAEALAIAQEIIEAMGLSHRSQAQAAGLTIMETKLLELSRALATRPKLLLVDEPMAGLNPEETGRIGETVKFIGRSGITVVVIEHVVQSLVKIVDWMVSLDHGRKIAEGTPDQVVSNPQVVEAYLGARWRERYARG